MIFLEAQNVQRIFTSFDEFKEFPGVESPRYTCLTGWALISIVNGGFSAQLLVSFGQAKYID